MQREQKSARLLAIYWIKMEKKEDHGCHKVQDLVDEEMWICLCNPLERKAKLFSSWVRQHLKLYFFSFVQSIVNFYEIKSSFKRFNRFFFQGSLLRN